MKLNSGDLEALVKSDDSDLIDNLSELETYESSRVNRTKLHMQDRMEINQRSKNIKYRESSKRNWSDLDG